MKFIKHLLVVSTLLLASVGNAKTIYVNWETGNNANPGTDHLFPKKSVAFTPNVPSVSGTSAWGAASPGDIIYLYPTATPHPGIYLGGKAGTQSAPITISGLTVNGVKPKIDGGTVYNAIFADDGVNYIRILNLEMSGRSLSSNGNGKPCINAKRNHHIEIAFNTIHNCSGSGIGTSNGDYAYFHDNIVYNTSRATGADIPDGNRIYYSGISTHGPMDWDTNRGYKTFIYNNIVYDNKNVRHITADQGNSDGNGIILDDHKRDQSFGGAGAPDYLTCTWAYPSSTIAGNNNKHCPYRGGTQVFNNLVFNNGGSGIRVYKSLNVLSFNNTLYLNNTDPDIAGWKPAELHMNDAGGSAAWGNILFSSGSNGTSNTGSYVSLTIVNSESGGEVKYDYNVYWNSKGSAGSGQAFYIPSSGQHVNTVKVTGGANNVYANPLFKNPTFNAATANFRVNNGSPALKVMPTFQASKFDIMNVQRGTSPRIGAYQNQ